MVVIFQFQFPLPYRVSRGIYSPRLYMNNAIAPSLPLMLLLPPQYVQDPRASGASSPLFSVNSSLFIAIMPIEQASSLILSASHAKSWRSCRLSRYDQSKPVYPLACRPRNASQTVSSRRYQCMSGAVSRGCHAGSLAENLPRTTMRISIYFRLPAQVCDDLYAIDPKSST